MVSPKFTTHSNESLNAIKSNFAGKNTNWRSSFILRMSFAVLQKNNPYLYYLDLLNSLSLPMPSDESIEIITKTKITVQNLRKCQKKEYAKIQLSP